MPWLDKDFYFTHLKDNRSQILQSVVNRFIYNLENSTFTEGYIIENEAFLRDKKHRNRFQ